MKIRVYGKDYAEQVRKYEPFVIDTTQFPQLELEVEAITSAYDEGIPTASSTMKGLMEKLQTKMWEVNFNVETSDYGHQTSLWEHFEPDGGNPQWDKFNNEISWLELDGIGEE